MNPSRGSLLRASTAISDDGSKLLVNLPKGSSFVMTMLGRADVSELIDGIVETVFGKRTIVYAESSLKGADIARSNAASAPPSSALSSPAAPRQPQAPAPMSAAPSPEAQREEVQHEEVPLDAYDDVPFVEDEESPATQVAPTPATPTPATPAPAASPAPASPSKTTPATKPSPDPGMPQEMSQLLDMLTEVFGDGVEVRVERPRGRAGSST